jgi:hypothetical protein
LLRLHPDKGGSNDDFILANELQKRITNEIDMTELIIDNIKIVQSFIYKATIGFKSKDTATDMVRLCREPTSDNAKSVMIVSANLYGIYSVFDLMSILIIAPDSYLKTIEPSVKL